MLNVAAQNNLLQELTLVLILLYFNSMKKVIRKLVGKLYVNLMEEPKKEGMSLLLDKIENITKESILADIEREKEFDDDVMPSESIEEEIYYVFRDFVLKNN